MGIADDIIDQIIDPFRVRTKRRTTKKESKELLIQGKGKWVKVLGEPVWGYGNAHKEWSLDLYVEGDTIERLKAEGLGSKIKDKGNGSYITFKRRQLKSDGTTPNQPIRVVDHRNDLWDPKVSIGNGSTLNVNFAINEYGKGQKSANILSMQVWDLVKYEGGEFPTREDDKTWENEVQEA
jgi:hypothetical protein